MFKGKNIAPNIGKRLPTPKIRYQLIPLPPPVISTAQVTIPPAGAGVGAGAAVEVGPVGSGTV